MTVNELERIAELEDKVEELAYFGRMLRGRIDRLDGAVDGITEIDRVRFDAIDAHVAALEEREASRPTCPPAITLAPSEYESEWEITDLRMKVGTLEAEVSSLKEKLDSSERACGNLGQIIDALEDDISDLEGALEEAERDLREERRAK